MISLGLWVGLVITDCNLSSCLQSVSMDWSDDICFLCARMAPSICCLCSSNKPINEWRKLLFRTILTHIPQSLWFKNIPEIFHLSSHYWRLLCEFSDLFSTSTYWRRHFSDSWKPYILLKIFYAMVNWFVCFISCSASTAVRARVLLLGGTRWTTNYFHRTHFFFLLLENRTPQRHTATYCSLCKQHGPYYIYWKNNSQFFFISYTYL